MKRLFQTLVLLLAALMVPTTAVAAFVQLADGWYSPAESQARGLSSVGDLNNDDFVNMDDLTIMINYLLTNDATGINLDNADTMGATPEQGSDADVFEKPAHQVTLSSYSIGETEVTQALWLAVMGSNPSYFTPTNGYAENLQRPVESVCWSWDSCQVFISKLNEMTGKNFRLPTEAEWEYAARGGKLSQGYKYAGSNNFNDVSWNGYNIPSQESGTEGYGTHPVATKSPNELGLYDMSGNVYEWCQDWYGDYTGDSQTNPVGPSTGTLHVYRGGCWRNHYLECRVSNRNAYPPANPWRLIGLRLAL